MYPLQWFWQVNLLCWSESLFYPKFLTLFDFFGRFLEPGRSKFCPSDKKNILEKKKYLLLFDQNQKILLYKWRRISFWTTCIEGIFELGQIADSIFFFKFFKFWGVTYWKRPKNVGRSSIQGIRQAFSGSSVGIYYRNKHFSTNIQRFSTIYDQTNQFCQKKWKNPKLFPMAGDIQKL